MGNLCIEELELHLFMQVRIR